MVAILVNEPFGLSLDQVGRLTPWQVRNVYLIDRDPKTGLPVRKGQQGTWKPYKAIFYGVWQRRGLGKEAVDLLWTRYQEKQRQEGKKRGNRHGRGKGPGSQQ